MIRLAKMAEVTPDTIRYYEKQQMMEHEVRTGWVSPVYRKRSPAIEKFIRHARQLGFSLEWNPRVAVDHIVLNTIPVRESKGIVQGKIAGSRSSYSRVAEYAAFLATP